MIRIFALLIPVLLAFQTQAGPLTNKVEADGDAKLSADQQAEYSRLLESGAQNIEQGNLDTAEQEFLSILKFAPKKALAYFNLGIVQYRKGQFEKAIGYFDQVIKMKSYYVGAAFYYKAVAQNNLGDTEGALKTARRFTEARYFYDMSQNLIRSIQAGSDEPFDNAVAAYRDQNYELCLLEIGLSVFSEAAKGRELTKKCQDGLEEEKRRENAAPPSAPVEEKTTASRFRIDTYLNNTNNLYQTNSGQVQKTVYAGDFSGEYVFKNKVDVGIGANYYHTNAFDTAHFKEETLGVTVPVSYRMDDHRFSTELFYNQNKSDDANSFSDYGFFLAYLRSLEEGTIGVAGSARNKKSQSTLFDFKTGNYQTVRVFGSRYLGAWTFGAGLTYEMNTGSDLDAGSYILPYQNRAKKFGYNVGYDINQVSDVSIKALYSIYDFTNVYSKRNIARRDDSTSLVLKYVYKLSKVLNIYLSQNLISTKSNYDDNEGINKNFSESSTSLGLTMYLVN